MKTTFVYTFVRESYTLHQKFDHCRSNIHYRIDQYIYIYIYKLFNFESKIKKDVKLMSLALNVSGGILLGHLNY